MSEGVVESHQQGDTGQPLNLQEAVEVLRARLSSVRVKVVAKEGDSALSVHFLGDRANMAERRLLTSSLAEYLPPALSVLGIGSEKERGDEEALSENAS